MDEGEGSSRYLPFDGYPCKEVWVLEEQGLGNRRRSAVGECMIWVLRLAVLIAITQARRCSQHN